jgi:hypothetical protein
LRSLDNPFEILAEALINLHALGSETIAEDLDWRKRGRTSTGTWH